MALRARKGVCRRYGSEDSQSWCVYWSRRTSKRKKANARPGGSPLCHLQGSNSHRANEAVYLQWRDVAEVEWLFLWWRLFPPRVTTTNASVETFAVYVAPKKEKKKNESCLHILFYSRQVIKHHQLWEKNPQQAFTQTWRMPLLPLQQGLP